jgi:hypothetical protein
VCRIYPAWADISDGNQIYPDVDIPTHDDSPIAIKAPITRACARQLQYQVKSFLSSTPCQLQYRLLPNEIIIVRDEGQTYEGLKNYLGRAQDQDVDKVLDKRRDERNKMEAYSETDVSPTQIPGPVRLQIESQNAYELGFSHSLYGWKDNDGSFPMLPV